MSVAHRENGKNLDPGIRPVLEQIRDLRVEMRDDRRQAVEDRRRSDARFDRVLAQVREDSVRREAATQKILVRSEQTVKRIHSVGLSIVKTLNRHTRLLEHQTHVLERHGRVLERIDRKLGVRDNGGSRPSNGRST